MSDAAILEILQDAVKLAVAACDVPALPVQFVACDMSPPNDHKWLECVYLPNNPADDYFGDERNYRGSFRMILHWPKNGAGAYAPLALIGQIAGYFSKSALLQNVQIYDSPKLAGAIEGASETLYPATLRYMCFQG